MDLFPHLDDLVSIILNIMFPFKMLLRMYSLCILLVDIVWVMVNTAFAILQACYEVIRPPALKSVRLETALVVGAGRGVGRYIALQLAEQGAIVICVDKNKENNDDTIQLIKSKGGVATGYTCDITKKHNVDTLAIQVKNELGFVSMLFYCCGIPSPRSLMTQPPQNIHDTLDLTLTSYFWAKQHSARLIQECVIADHSFLTAISVLQLINHYMPSMKAKNHGHIVALTSVAGLSYIKDQMPLSVAQFAVQGLAESLMEDLRINKISGVHVTLAHIYPFIVGDDTPDLKLRIPSYFGTITPDAAARSILDSVRRNNPEASVPKHLLYLGHLLRILPRKATTLMRDLLDTGVDFA